MISILIPSGIMLAVYWARYFLAEHRKGIPLTVPLVFTCLFIPKLNLLEVKHKDVLDQLKQGVVNDDIKKILAEEASVIASGQPLTSNL